MASSYSIRSIEKRDVPALFQLIYALADNQGERSGLTVSVERLTETGFGETPRWRGFIVEDEEGRPVGYATYTEDFHIWSGAPRISLDDIYVQSDYRGAGVGEALMRRVFELAEQQGAFVNWTVQTGNERAIAFYERLGAQYRVIGKCGWRAS